MKERPIIFTAPEVRAILGGRKTMTRQIIKLPEIISEPGDADATSVGWLDHHESGPGWHGWMSEYPEEGSAPLRCPYGQPGDRLVVTMEIPGAGAETLQVEQDVPVDRIPRITLEIESVRVERLQDISEADALAEGCPCYVCGAPLDGNSEADCHCFHRTATASDYRDLWEHINGEGSWAADPWVWVLAFKRVTPP